MPYPCTLCKPADSMQCPLPLSVCVLTRPRHSVLSLSLTLTLALALALTQAFRPGMKALQASGDVVVSGSSYNELGVGFT